jgi:hypothetical protein
MAFGGRIHIRQKGTGEERRVSDFASVAHQLEL